MLFTVKSLIAITSRKRPTALGDHFVNNRFVSQSNTVPRVGCLGVVVSGLPSPLGAERRLLSRTAAGNGAYSESSGTRPPDMITYDR